MKVKKNNKDKENFIQTVVFCDFPTVLDFMMPPSLTGKDPLPSRSYFSRSVYDLNVQMTDAGWVPCDVRWDNSKGTKTLIQNLRFRWKNSNYQSENRKRASEIRGPCGVWKIYLKVCPYCSPSKLLSRLLRHNWGYVQGHSNSFRYLMS